MKHSRFSTIRFRFLLLGFAGLSSFAPAQVQPKYETVYDCHKSTYALASLPFRTFTNVFGQKNWTLPVEAFTGTSSMGLPVAGFKAGITFPLADQVRAGIDIAWLNEQGQKGRFAVFGKIAF